MTRRHGEVYFNYSVAHLLEDVNSVFNLIANIRKKENDSFVYSIQLNENKKIEASPPLDSLLRASNGVPNTSNYSISQDTVSVNRNFSENANKYQDRDPDAAIRYSDRTFSYDELVAKGKIIGTTIKNSTEVPLKDDGSIDAGKIVEAEILGKLHAVNAKK